MCERKTVHIYQMVFESVKTLVNSLMDIARSTVATLVTLL
jgi:hypothetical protein